MAAKPAASDEYSSPLSKEKRTTLKKLRRAIKAAAPVGLGRELRACLEMPCRERFVLILLAFLVGEAAPTGRAQDLLAGLDPEATITTGTIAPTPTPSASPTPKPKHVVQVINFSTRMRVQIGDNVAIGGLIITGNHSAASSSAGSGPSGAPTRVLLRAIGPSLAGSGLSGVLADPVIDLRGDCGAEICAPEEYVQITNDDWRDTQEPEIEATGIPPAGDLESAIVTTLLPGMYTVAVRGSDDSSGVALVEVYDLDHGHESKLANLSTRALVGTGDDLVIAGFLLSGESGDDGIVVRGIGPSLTAVGVPDALADPTLELRDTSGTLLAANNDWQDNAGQAAELTAAGLAPADPLESGIALVLPPGSFTVLLTGHNNGTGIGLVEVYDRGELK